MDRRSLVFGAFLGFLVAQSPSFLNHLTFFLSGQVSEMMFQGNWTLVALNIGGFLLFLIPLAYRRKADWRSYGIYTAFIVSLFVEMYGIPLTVYLGSGLLSSSMTPPDVVLTLSFFGTSLAMNYWMIIGALITSIGMLIVTVGWAQIYRGEGLVTDGIYKYSRHPQYLGIILIAVGWFIGWPTLLTMAILPILTYEYYRLSFKEEEEVIEELGEEKYQEYREKTPLLI
ncbi:MAG: methyltransferase [Candidatus Nanohaloarchaea archaeon]